MRRWPAVLLLALVGLAWAQTDRPRFETTQSAIALGAGHGAFAELWVNISTDRYTGATLYTLTRPQGSSIEVLGFAAIPPTRPSPMPTPTPAACDDSWGASLKMDLVLHPTHVEATFTGNWITPPAEGTLSDNSMPIRAVSVAPGQPVTWEYGRGSAPQANFGFLSLVRTGPEFCDLRVDFIVPAV